MPHWLEIGKFSVYVGLPISVAYLFSKPENINKAINYYKFIVYPPENPQSSEDIRALEVEQAKIRQRKLLQQQQAREEH